MERQQIDYRKRKSYRKNKQMVEFKFYRIVVICNADYINMKILNSQTYLSPSVGIGVFVLNTKEEKILLGRRRDSGLFGLPGGWLELGESWEDCASRELQEETGLYKHPDNFGHIHTLNCRMLAFNFHNISCVMIIELDSEDFDKVENAEPHKCCGWLWISVEDMKKDISRLFYPLRHFFCKFPDIQKASDLQKMRRY